jgi:hypothetical protein
MSKSILSFKHEADPYSYYDLINPNIVSWIKAVSWIFFGLAVLGAISLWLASTETRTTGYMGLDTYTVVNPYMRIMSIVGLLASTIILLIGLGIARSIQQNFYIMHRLKKLEPLLTLLPKEE